MHLVYPPKFCITIVFDFSWNDCNTQEKLETMVMQNLGVNKVYRSMWKWWMVEWEGQLMQLFAQRCCFTCSTCYATNIATRNKEILLRENVVVADYQQCCGKSCMNLLPILSHLYRLRYSLQNKSTILTDQFPRALLKKWQFFAPGQVVVRFCRFWSIWTNARCCSWTY